jgi:flagellar motility protein MotE (MotC chaperone)
MLDEFAGQLASMPVAEASETMSPLDNETAALTLNRLGKARRNAILRTLAPKKRATLEKLIRKKR